ncbi:hypothetical protein [Nostoc sp.]
MNSEWASRAIAPVEVKHGFAFRRPKAYPLITKPRHKLRKQLQSA